MIHDRIKHNENEDDINLWELLKHIKSGWYWLASGGVIGLIGAIGFVVISPAKYEAVAVIKPATVGFATAASNAAASNATTLSGLSSIEVEPVAQTIERLRTPAFYTDDLLKACGLEQSENSRKVLSLAIKSSLIKGNSLIQVSYRAGTPKVAEGCVTAVVGHLTRVQADLAAPLMRALEEQRELTKHQLDEAEQYQAQLRNQIRHSSNASDNFSQYLLRDAVYSTQDEVYRLRRLFIDQTLQLTEPITQPVKLLEPIYSPDLVVYPNKWGVVLGGLIGGLLVGGIALFVGLSWRRFVAIEK